MTRLIPALWLGLLLGACSDRPSDRAGRDAFEGHARKAAGGTEIALTAFRKTDGQAFEQDGVRGYRLFYTSAVAFPRGFRPDCLASESIAARMECVAGALILSGSEPVPPGSTISYSGDIVFERRENGWVPGRIQMARTGIAVAGEPK